jgi:hypothetical protein
VNASVQIGIQQNKTSVIRFSVNYKSTMHKLTRQTICTTDKVDHGTRAIMAHSFKLIINPTSINFEVIRFNPLPCKYLIFKAIIIIKINRPVLHILKLKSEKTQRSGLYRGCSRTSHLKFRSVSFVLLAVWGRALSCKSNTPLVRSPGRFVEWPYEVF